MAVFCLKLLNSCKNRKIWSHKTFWLLKTIKINATKYKIKTTLEKDKKIKKTLAKATRLAFDKNRVKPHFFKTSTKKKWVSLIRFCVFILCLNVLCTTEKNNRNLFYWTFWRKKWSILGYSQILCVTELGLSYIGPTINLSQRKKG